jgi:hypothetical protein
LVFASGSTAIPAGAAEGATAIVTVAGLPPYSATQARRTLLDVDSEILPSSVTVFVSSATAAPGATTWQYTVTIHRSAPSVAPPAFSVKLDLIAAPVA